MMQCRGANQQVFKRNNNTSKRLLPGNPAGQPGNPCGHRIDFDVRQKIIQKRLAKFPVDLKLCSLDSVRKFEYGHNR